MLALWPALPGIAPRPIALRTTAIATTTTAEPHIGKPGSMASICATPRQTLVRGDSDSMYLVLSWNGKRNAEILADGTAWDINGARLVAS